ncbi:hypothetical protein GCM10023231_33660 [Olivibacter ginsenosidimutans]|uniref:histidine kinase n=1 Tax=Olivibacter ginsenosidimutans TaxID=1176537 RepID=A0ABP9BZV2_9SPHI
MCHTAYIRIPILTFFIFLIGGKAYAQSKLLNEELSNLPFIKDSVVKVDKLNRIGMLYHMKNPDSCFYYGMQAKALATHLNYGKGEAEADNVIAISLFVRNMFQEGLKLYSKSVLPKFKKYGNQENIVEATMNISIAYANLGDLPQGRKLVSEALQMGQHLEKDSIMSLVYLNYCMINRGNLPDNTVDDYLNKATVVANKYHDERAKVAIALVRAEQLLNKGLVDKALLLVRPSLQFTKDQEMDLHEIHALDLYAACYQNQPDSVIKMFDRMYALIQKDGYVHLRLAALEVIWRNQDALHKKIDLDHFHQLTEKSMMDINRNLTQFIGDYIKYNDLENNNRLLKVNNQTNRYKIWFLIGLILALVLVAIFVYVLYLNSRRYSKRQKQLNMRIMEQRDSLLAADRFKSELVAILAHDFRSPLSSIVGMIGVMRDLTGMSVEEQKIFYNELEQETTGMLHSFERILKWIRLQLSGHPFSFEAANLHTLFAEVIVDFQRRLQEKQITVNNHVSISLAVETDIEAIQFINRNLLSNAIRFSPTYGKINLEAQEDEQSVTVKVIDEGPGVDNKMLDNLFKVSDVLPRGERETGIALSISKDFISRLGGRIWVEKNHPTGAIFCYSIPKSHQDALPHDGLV